MDKNSQKTKKDYNKENFEEYKVVQTARILLNKEIYTHSFIKEN